MKQKIVFDDNWRFNLGDLPPKTPADSWGGAKACGYLNSVGLCQVIARADGEVCLTVKSDGLEKGELKIK